MIAGKGVTALRSTLEQRSPATKVQDVRLSIYGMTNRLLVCWKAFESVHSAVWKQVHLLVKKKQPSVRNLWASDDTSVQAAIFVSVWNHVRAFETHLLGAGFFLPSNKRIHLNIFSTAFEADRNETSETTCEYMRRTKFESLVDKSVKECYCETGRPNSSRSD